MLTWRPALRALGDPDLPISVSTALQFHFIFPTPPDAEDKKHILHFLLYPPVFQ